MTEPQPPSGLWRGAFQVVLSYAVFAGLWILLSDRAMGLMFSDHELLVQAGMVKGWLFVAVTSLLLYVLIRRLVGRIEEANRRELAAEREKRQALELLQAVLDATDDAIFAKDAEGRYLLHNRGAERMSGRPATTVVGCDDMQVFPPDVAANIQAADRTVLQDGRTLRHEETIPGPDGPTEVEVTKTPLRDAAGKVVGLVGIARNIAGRKRAETALRDSEALFRILFERAPVGINLVQPDGMPIRNNAAMQRLLGRTEEQLRHHHFKEWTHPDDIPSSQALVERLLSGESEVETIEKRYVHPDGTVIWVHTTVTAVRDEQGAVRFFITLVEDITDRKTAATDLEARNEELERFNRASVGRELDMVELKRKINMLSQELGREPPYSLAFLDDEQGRDAS